MDMKKIKTLLKAAICMLLAAATAFSLAGCAGGFPKESDDIKEDEGDIILWMMRMKPSTISSNW